MTVKQLREELSKYPDYMYVFMAERKTEFDYGLINSVSTKRINFKEDPSDEESLATEDVVILDEE